MLQGQIEGYLKSLEESLIEPSLQQAGEGNFLHKWFGDKFQENNGVFPRTKAQSVNLGNLINQRNMN